VIADDGNASAFWDAYLEFETTHCIQNTCSYPLTGSKLGNNSIYNLQYFIFSFCLFFCSILFSLLVIYFYLGTLYRHLIGLPLKDIERFFILFNKYTSTHTLNELLTIEEANELMKIHPKILDENIPPESIVTWENEIRRDLLVTRSTRYNVAISIRNERYPFESRILRTYFHVTPIDTNELNIWHSYLDYSEQKTSKLISEDEIDIDVSLLSETIKLYERCLLRVFINILKY
jgi:hypothetical protein